MMQESWQVQTPQEPWQVQTPQIPEQQPQQLSNLEDYQHRGLMAIVEEKKRRLLQQQEEQESARAALDAQELMNQENFRLMEQQLMEQQMQQDVMPTEEYAMPMSVHMGNKRDNWQR